MTQSRGPLERLLGLFTEVRAVRARTALLLTLNVFLLLTAYYIIKPVREALILGRRRRRAEELRVGGPGAAAARGGAALRLAGRSRCPRRG